MDKVLFHAIGDQHSPKMFDQSAILMQVLASPPPPGVQADRYLQHLCCVAHASSTMAKHINCCKHPYKASPRVGMVMSGVTPFWSHVLHRRVNVGAAAAAG